MRLTRRATVLAVIAASVLLSAFQPASAEVFGNGRAWVEIQQGDFKIRVSVFEDGDVVCASIHKVSTGEYHWPWCKAGDVEVSDTLESASARGTASWTKTTATKGKGPKSGTTSVSGSLTVDAAWTGTGEMSPKASEIKIDETKNCPWFASECYPGIETSETSLQRSATLSGTIIDSEWGTFVLDGASGYLHQRILQPVY